MLDDLLTLDEAADEFPISYWALAKAAQRGRLAAKKIGSGSRSPYATTRVDVARYVAETEARRKARGR